MPADPAQRAITAYLNDAAEDLAAFALLASGGNRFAVYHLHQAAEKLVSAVRLHRGLLLSKYHDLVLLLDGHQGDPTKEPRPLPPGDVWRPRLQPLEWLSRYAT